MQYMTLVFADLCSADKTTDTKMHGFAQFLYNSKAETK